MLFDSIKVIVVDDDEDVRPKMTDSATPNVCEAADCDCELKQCVRCGRLVCPAFTNDLEHADKCQGINSTAVDVFRASIMFNNARSEDVVVQKLCEATGYGASDANEFFLHTWLIGVGLFSRYVTLYESLLKAVAFHEPNAYQKHGRTLDRDGVKKHVELMMGLEMTRQSDDMLTFKSNTVNQKSFDFVVKEVVRYEPRVKKNETDPNPYFFSAMLRNSIAHSQFEIQFHDGSLRLFNQQVDGTRDFEIVVERDIIDKLLTWVEECVVFNGALKF